MTLENIYRYIKVSDLKTRLFQDDTILIELLENASNNTVLLYIIHITTYIYKSVIKQNFKSVDKCLL